MSRTITAMFDNRAHAEAARDRLASTGIDASDVQIMDQSSSGYRSDSYSTHEDKGIWASIKGLFIPDEDRHTYEEGVRRGHVVLTAEVDESRADEAVRVLDGAGSVDIDERSAGWRAGGWTGATPAPTDNTLSRGSTSTAMDRDRLGTTGDETRIPIIEEQLRVGKRETARGGVKVRSYMVETPVNEQVTLRDEHVSVERRAVNQPLRASDTDAFRERSFEMTESHEEAVVSKEAVVREELVVRKDSDTRTETISDSVRRTEVDIDRDGDLTSGRTTGRGDILDRDGDGRTELTDGTAAGGRGSLLDRDGDGKTEVTDGVGVRNPANR